MIREFLQRLQMQFSNQNVQSSDDSFVAIILSYLTEGIYFAKDSLTSQLKDCWHHIQTGGILVQVLCVLLCWLLINIILLQVAWRVYKEVICSPVIPDLVAKYSPLSEKDEGKPQTK